MSKTTPQTSELRDRLAGVLCPPHHREGFGGTITSADGTSRSLGSKRRPCLLHTAQADALLPVVAQEIAAAEQRGREAVVRALFAARVVCPVHGIPDCGPLLNGCSAPRFIAEWRGEFIGDLTAALAELAADESP